MPQPLVQTTGRRKQAVARVRVRPNEAEGDGTITVNGGRSPTTSRRRPTG